MSNNDKNDAFFPRCKIDSSREPPQSTVVQDQTKYILGALVSLCPICVKYILFCVFCTSTYLYYRTIFLMIQDYNFIILRFYYVLHVITRTFYAYITK